MHDDEEDDDADADDLMIIIIIIIYRHLIIFAMVKRPKGRAGGIAARWQKLRTANHFSVRFSVQVPQNGFGVF